MDLRNAIVGFSYGRAGNPTDVLEVTAFISMAEEGILAKLELWLSRQPLFCQESPFFVSGHATAPDFHIFELLDQLNLLAECTPLPAVTDAPSLPHIHSFYLGFKKLQSNEKYFKSAMSQAPCNNLTAVFGSLPKGQRWEKGMKLPDDTSGVY
jgi:hypothetical protein